MKLQVLPTLLLVQPQEFRHFSLQVFRPTLFTAGIAPILSFFLHHRVDRLRSRPSRAWRYGLDDEVLLHEVFPIYARALIRFQHLRYHTLCLLAHVRVLQPRPPEWLTRQREEIPEIFRRQQQLHRNDAQGVQVHLETVLQLVMNFRRHSERCTQRSLRHLRLSEKFLTQAEVDYLDLNPCGEGFRSQLAQGDRVVVGGIDQYVLKLNIPMDY